MKSQAEVLAYLSSHGFAFEQQAGSERVYDIAYYVDMYAMRQAMGKPYTSLDIFADVLFDCNPEYVERKSAELLAFVKRLREHVERVASECECSISGGVEHIPDPYECGDDAYFFSYVLTFA